MNQNEMYNESVEGLGLMSREELEEEVRRLDHQVASNIVGLGVTVLASITLPITPFAGSMVGSFFGSRLSRDTADLKVKKKLLKNWVE